MFDPVLLELLWARLVSIVDEAAATLLRSSFSTVVRESHDFGCVLTDAQGRSVVQALDANNNINVPLPNLQGMGRPEIPLIAITKVCYEYIERFWA